MKKLFFAIAVLILTAGNGFCEKAPVVFGKIEAQDVSMRTYDQDTSAAAVILCDYGWFDVNNIMFTRILRVKILKKAGFDLGSFKYLTGSKPSVKGMVYNMQGEEVIKEKLPSTSLFFKKVGDYYETSFAIPNIREGTVFDIQYTFDGLPFEWAFQSEIPVRHSELVIPESPYLKFSRNFFGYIPLAVSTADRWVANNVPAFKAEPFINSSENFISKMEIELREISIPGYATRFYTTSWEDVNANLTANTWFPSQSQLLLCISSIADELKSSGKKGDDLIRAAFEAMKKEAYNNERSIYISDEGLCNHFKSGSGNVADINFTLLQLLKHLGFEAYPVVLSTRANGMLSPISPSRNKLNYVIVALKKQEGFMLLDATEKYMPCNLLPDRVVNGNGRIVSDKYSQWIPLIPTGKEISEYNYDLKLNEDMTMTGTMKVILSGYAAYDFRDYYASFNNKDEYARDAEKMNPGLIVNDVAIENLEDLYSPLTVIFDITIEGMVTPVDKELYITPMLFEQVKESPFKSAERVYPISYSRLEETKVNVAITLPENITAGVLPKPATSKTRNNAMAFTYSVASEGNIVKANYTYNINAYTITQDVYKEVRAVYNNLVSKHSEPVILNMQ